MTRITKHTLEMQLQAIKNILDRRIGRNIEVKLEKYAPGGGNVYYSFTVDGFARQIQTVGIRETFEALVAYKNALYHLDYLEKQEVQS